MNAVKAEIFSGRFLYRHKSALLFWFGLVFVALLLSFLHHDTFNNYKIFKYVFYHTLEQKNLYLPYPEYGDVNLYGPVFSMVIAPFALLPDALGSKLWVIAGAAFLFFAIMQLPIKKEFRYAIIVLNAIEMMNVAAWYQSNAVIAACIILGFVYTHRGKEHWALFFILLAAFVKIYGLAGLAFFFFSNNKWRYILWFVIWSAVFFLLPVTISSFHFIVQSYGDWYNAVVQKSAKNLNTFITHDFQDISAMGMIRRVFKFPQLNYTYIYITAIILFGLQYLQVKYYSDIRYRLYILCSALIFVVIFSTGSESPSYIIAFPAICLWYFLQNKSRAVNAFFILAFLLTSLSYSDLLTPYVREHIARPYSIKALPAFITWLIICWQVYSRQFLRVDLQKTI